MGQQVIAVFDASAVLAILRNEPGGDAASAYLPAGVISAVNLAEVLERLTADYDEQASQRAIAALGLIVMAAGEADALEAARLREPTRAAGLSLGDRFCLAAARRLSAPAITADRIWATVAETIAIRILSVR